MHPFILVESETKGQFFGIYFRNANAMSPVIRHDGTKSVFSYITTGGEMEINFMFKGGPKEIIKMYQNIIGLPSLPPLWSLGWHASAYAYVNQTMVQENIDGYAAAGIPLEGIWLDINYMDEFADFSVNTTAFPDLKNLTDTIHQNGQRMIPIIDAGISAEDPTSPYYAPALANDLLIMSTINPDLEHGVLTQHVWPNHTVFLDFH